MTEILLSNKFLIGYGMLGFVYWAYLMVTLLKEERDYDVFKELVKRSKRHL